VSMMGDIARLGSSTRQCRKLLNKPAVPEEQLWEAGRLCDNVVKVMRLKRSGTLT
jgi:hypothetical protein